MKKLKGSFNPDIKLQPEPNSVEAVGEMETRAAVEKSKIISFS